MGILLVRPHKVIFKIFNCRFVEDALRGQADTCISWDTRHPIQLSNEILYVLQLSDCGSLLKPPNLGDNTFFLCCV